MLNALIITKKITFFLFFCIYVSLDDAAHAMVSSNLYTHQDYVKLAQNEKIYETACAITDPSTGANQSGVLISKNIVATAAHGVVHILDLKNIPIHDETVAIPVKNLFVTFTKPYQLKVEVTHVLVSPQYVTKVMGKEAKYDIAFLKLKNPIDHITIPDFYNATSIDITMPAYVVTLGTLGSPEFTPLVARAFALLEFDHIYIHQLDEDTLATNKPILLSSIFFNPEENFNTTKDDEIISRNKTALKQWKKHNKPPYGLALYGSSGAPVFAHIQVGKQKKLALIGIITGFAPLGEKSFTKNQINNPFFFLIIRIKFKDTFKVFLLYFMWKIQLRIKKILYTLKKIQL